MRGVQTDKWDPKQPKQKTLTTRPLQPSDKNVKQKYVAYYYSYSETPCCVSPLQSDAEL